MLTILTTYKDFMIKQMCYYLHVTNGASLNPIILPAVQIDLTSSQSSDHCHVLVSLLLC